jgi:hypothetical protein
VLNAIYVEKLASLHHNSWSINPMQLAIEIPLLVAVWPFDGWSVFAMAFTVQPPFAIAIRRIECRATYTVMSTVDQPFLSAIVVANGWAFLIVDLTGCIIPFSSVVKNLRTQYALLLLVSA